MLLPLPPLDVMREITFMEPTMLECSDHNRTSQYDVQAFRRLDVLTL